MKAYWIALYTKIKSVENLNKYSQVAQPLFKKYGAVGSSLASHLGRDNGLYTTTIGYENYAHFGEVDDKLSNDENWAKDMEPFFSDTKWETNNFYEPLVHNMPSDAGIKPVFAHWMFFHKDINLIQEKGDIFIKAWMESGATGGTVGRLNGKDITVVDVFEGVGKYNAGELSDDELKDLEAQTSSQGPIKSSYGWHTILMSEVKDSYIPDFETVRNRVLSEATIELRSSANDVYYDELKSRYDIAYPESAMR